MRRKFRLPFIDCAKHKLVFFIFLISMVFASNFIILKTSTFCAVSYSDDSIKNGIDRCRNLFVFEWEFKVSFLVFKLAYLLALV